MGNIYLKAVILFLSISPKFPNGLNSWGREGGVFQVFKEFPLLFHYFFTEKNQTWGR